MATSKYKAGQQFAYRSSDGKATDTAELCSFDAYTGVWRGKWHEDGGPIGISEEGIDSAVASGRWTPIAPPRTSLAECKGHVGMRVRGSMATFTLTADLGEGIWRAHQDGDAEPRDAIFDRDIGAVWTILPAQPAAITPAAQVEPFVGMRFKVLTAFVFTSYDAATDRWIHRSETSGVEQATRHTSAQIRELFARGTWKPLPDAAPTTTPPPPYKVVPNATALRRYEGAQQAEGTKYMRDADRREGSAAFTAAVSLRLAARAEAKRIREQQHCQPNYVGGDDVDE